jgi:hypothetical protein
MDYAVLVNSEYVNLVKKFASISKEKCSPGGTEYNRLMQKNNQNFLILATLQYCPSLNI